MKHLWSFSTPKMITLFILMIWKIKYLVKRRILSLYIRRVHSMNNYMIQKAHNRRSLQNSPCNNKQKNISHQLPPPHNHQKIHQNRLILQNKVLNKTNRKTKMRNQNNSTLSNNQNKN